jgi:hypothetical protein
MTPSGRSAGSRLARVISKVAHGLYRAARHFAHGLYRYATLSRPRDGASRIPLERGLSNSKPKTGRFRSTW